MTLNEEFRLGVLLIKGLSIDELNELTNLLKIEREEYYQNQLKKRTPNYEEMEVYIENYIKENGIKSHDLSIENDCLTENGVHNVCDWLKQKLLKSTTQ